MQSFVLIDQTLLKKGIAYSVCMLKKGIQDLKFLFIVVAFSLNLQSPVTVGWTVAL
jgi:hypothetical protein